MSSTRGGDNQRKAFEWQLTGNEIHIENDDGRKDIYTLPEIYEISLWLSDKFEENMFPLANNVEKMGNGDERDGLGMAILNQSPGDTTHAQGASYLGVVLEEVGIFEWNGASNNICWRIVNMPDSLDQIKLLIETHLS